MPRNEIKAVAIVNTIPPKKLKPSYFLPELLEHSESGVGVGVLLCPLGFFSC